MSNVRSAWTSFWCLASIKLQITYWSRLLHVWSVLYRSWLHRFTPPCWLPLPAILYLLVVLSVDQSRAAFTQRVHLSVFVFVLIVGLVLEVVVVARVLRTTNGHLLMPNGLVHIFLVHWRAVYLIVSLPNVHIKTRDLHIRHLFFLKVEWCTGVDRLNSRLCRLTSYCINLVSLLSIITWMTVTVCSILVSVGILGNGR